MMTTKNEVFICEENDSCMNNSSSILDFFRKSLYVWDEIQILNPQAEIL